MVRILSLSLLIAIQLAGAEIVISPSANPVERHAAAELSAALGKLFPRETFRTVRRPGAQGPYLFVGSAERPPRALEPGWLASLKAPEAVLARTFRHHNQPAVLIAGQNARATLFAVYRLLERLGFGYYLSGDAVPPPSALPLGFADWEFADAPLAPERIVFDWHNFLSGCTTWNLRDWQRWIDQSAKMRFNTIMVHGYGNSPIFTFEHNGQSKPVGYLATTRNGRDWGTQHVLDVRTMIGGAAFSGPVFGADAALAPDGRRVEAATTLMRQVFAHAASRGLEITYALDVDTESTNPLNVLSTLPPRALFKKNGYLLADPDVPEGYAYYRSQAQALFRLYPEITQLAIWVRASRRGLWCQLLPQDFPAAWRPEYEAAIAANPAMAADADAPSQFAIAKIVKAFRKALDETGHSSVRLALGGWRLYFLKAADAFMPKEVKLLPLDYEIHFGQEAVRQSLRAIATHRPLTPIVWAHHDDHSYIGRPYRPFGKFQSLLESAGASGFGIIHWTTRPLDLYFKSLAEQTWRQTRDQDQATLCADAAARMFSPAERERLGRYLCDWLTEGPIFGRETSDAFVDRPLDKPEETMAALRKRLAVLDSVPPESLPEEARVRLAYFREYERFCLQFYESHRAWEIAAAQLKSGNRAEAAQSIGRARPEAVIRQYLQAAQHGGPTRGELGILVSLNLRWLPLIVSMRQAAGLEPVRYVFHPTQHEDLAQGPGHNTFSFDSEGRLWKVLGEKETGFPVTPAGLQFDKPLRLPANIGNQPLRPGRYRVTMAWSSGTETREIGITDAFLLQPDSARRTLTSVSLTSLEGLP